MAEKKIVAVVGATGTQGGGVVRAIQRDVKGPFTARGLTRNPASDRAGALRDLGAEVVAADLDDVESLKHAFRGAHGVYCVTNFFEHFAPDREIAQAGNMAAAAKAEGVAHVIWSTLDDTRAWMPLSDDRMPTLMGKYKVPHFDAKAEANERFTDAGVPVTFLYTSFYWDNFIYLGSGPKPRPDGELALTFPLGDARLPAMAAEDIGKCAYGIFRAGQEYIGRTVGVCGEQLTGNEMAAALTRALGRTVHYNDVPPEVYRSFGFPGAEDVGNMFQFMRDFNEDVCRSRDPATARALNPELLTFQDWLDRYADRIPLD